MIKIAISTGVYVRTRETQINNHIASLFGGNVVVLAQKLGDSPPSQPNYLIWDNVQKGNLLKDNIFSFFEAFVNYESNRTFKVPYGARRRCIKEFIQLHNVNVILCEFGTDALRIAPLANDLGVPVFAYFRGADASSYLRKSSHVAAYRKLMPRLRGVFSVSQFLLDNLNDHGIMHDHSHVIPSGVDTQRFAPGRKVAGTCLAVGRFVEKKRPDITVRAFIDVAKQFPHAKLEMIGEGPLLEHCKSIVANSGVSDQIIFHGLQSHEFVRKKLDDCEIFLQHSIKGCDGDTEGLPTSVQEAMSAGLVVVSTLHAGIPDAVRHGVTGFLVREGDERTYTKHIKDLVSGKHNLTQMGAEARRTAIKDFDRIKLQAKLENVILSLI